MELREYRCQSCNKLLFKGLLVDSTVEIKCKGCATLTTFRGEPSGQLLCLKKDCVNRVK
jgi:phage FluMu protein Com